MATSSHPPCAWSWTSGTSKPAHPALARVNRAVEYMGIEIRSALMLLFYWKSLSNIFFLLPVFSIVLAGFMPSVVLFVPDFETFATLWKGCPSRHSASFFVLVTPDSVVVASSHFSAGLLTA